MATAIDTKVITSFIVTDVEILKELASLVSVCWAIIEFFRKFGIKIVVFDGYLYIYVFLEITINRNNNIWPTLVMYNHHINFNSSIFWTALIIVNVIAGLVLGLIRLYFLDYSTVTQPAFVVLTQQTDKSRAYLEGRINATDSRLRVLEHRVDQLYVRDQKVVAPTSPNPTRKDI